MTTVQLTAAGVELRTEFIERTPADDGVQEKEVGVQRGRQVQRQPGKAIAVRGACQACGQPLPTKYRQYHYCSPLCRKSAALPSATDSRPCAACGTAFDGDPFERYCSARCRTLRHPESRVPCPSCGTLLDRRTRRYCSDRCWRRAHRR